MTGPRIRSSFVLIFAALLSACSSSDDGIIITDPPMAAATIQVNASTSTAYVALGSPATLVSVTDPTTSSAWDLAFTPTPTVSVNGGASGPGGVKAYCLCANASLPLAQVEALSSGTGSLAFDAVTAANVPADSLYRVGAGSGFRRDRAVHVRQHRPRRDARRGCRCRRLVEVILAGRFVRLSRRIRQGHRSPAARRHAEDGSDHRRRETSGALELVAHRSPRSIGAQRRRRRPMSD